MRKVRVVLVHLHLVRSLAVALRGTKRREAQVVVADGLSALEVIGVGFRLQPLCKSLVGLVRAHKMKKPFLLVAKHAAEAVPEVSVRAHLGLVVDGAIGRFVSPSQDVDGAPHRWNGELARAQATLNLSRAHHQVQTGPVAPVHPSVFHVVHGDTVNHHREVGLVEAPNGHTGISIPSSLLRGVHARGGVQDQRQITPRQFLLNLGGKDVGERHRGFAGNHHIR